MFRKKLSTPAILILAAVAVSQRPLVAQSGARGIETTPAPPGLSAENAPSAAPNPTGEQSEPEVAIRRQAVSPDPENTLYVTEQQPRELRFEKKVASIDGINQEILGVESLDANTLQLRPQRPGVTAFDVVDEAGNRQHFVVLVDGDTRQLELILRRHFPDAKIGVDAVQDAVILTGTLTDAAQVKQAVEVAEQFYPRVLNWLKVPSQHDSLAASSTSDATSFGEQHPESNRKSQPASMNRTAAAEDAPAAPELQQVISEIRSLRTLIQDVGGDVLNLQAALRNREHQTPQQQGETKPTGSQPAAGSAQAAIEGALNQPIELVAHDAPLQEVIRDLAQKAGINVVIDAMAFEEEGVAPDHAVSMALEGVTLRSTLHLLLDDLGLTTVIDNEVLKITSRVRAAGKLIVQAYRVPELAGTEADREVRLERLTTLIVSTIEPDSWAEVGGQGTISTFVGGSSLVIRQSQEVHTQIQGLLQSLTRLLDRETSGVPAAKTSPNNLEMLHRVGRISTPIVELPIRSTMVVNALPAMPTDSPLTDLRPQRSTGQPLQVDNGGLQTSAVTELPPVRVSDGRYQTILPSTVALVVRHYTPSRRLLLKFLNDGESDADAARKLVEHVRSSINPDSWKSDDVQAEVVIDGFVRIAIRHTPGAHDRIRRLFERMEAEVKAAASATSEAEAGKPKTGEPDAETNSGLAASDADAEPESGKAATLWTRLGLKLGPAVAGDPGEKNHTYHGGMRISEVRKISPASRAGLQSGDVLVGLDKWETLSPENVDYALQRIAEMERGTSLKFFVVRNGEMLFGRLFPELQPQ
ncbi:PDZ domain-containing protein [bacterium]|nr:PDZ domain-containing protein [bacterium]